MADLYTPRGYISTRQAIERLFETRHGDLLPAAREREREMRSLFDLKFPSIPSPISSIRAGAQGDSNCRRRKFTPADERRLNELDAMAHEMRAFWDAAAKDVRSALAEGDMSAILTKDDGHQRPISTTTWRGKDGLEYARAGRAKMQFPYAIGKTEGQALIKETDFIVWLSIAAPRKFAQVGISVIVQDSAPCTPAATTPEPLSQVNSEEALPMWLTLMETVAWIVARHPRIVGFASTKRKAMRSYVIDHELPNGKRLSGSVEPPAGMSLLWLDLFAAHDVDGAQPTSEALAELLAALKSGAITTRATWVATGERRYNGADEWHSLVIDTPPGDERTLLPFRLNPGWLAHQPENRWRDVLLPRDDVLAFWQPRVGGRAAGDPAQDLSIRSDAEDQASNSNHLELTGVGHQSQPAGRKPPVSSAALSQWYTNRRDGWPADRKHPSQDEDLAEAKERFPEHHVTRDASNARCDLA